MRSSSRLTVLNGMAGADFETALDTHVAWGLRDVDLKDSIFGKSIGALTADDARRAAELIGARGLRVHCLSSMLFDAAVEEGEGAFAARYLRHLERLLEVAALLQPRSIRLLAPQTERRDAIPDSVAYLASEQPWFLPMFQSAVRQVADGGFMATVENERGRCILSNGSEVVGFFEALDLGDLVELTWDVQNMWEMGAFPTMELYQQLRPFIGYYHVKGGQHDGTSLRLRWRTRLEDASWPVVNISRQVVADGVSPVICLNPPHGEPKPGEDMTNSCKDDIDFLRREVAGIE